MPGDRGRDGGVGRRLPRPRRGRGDPGAGARRLAARGRAGGQGDRPRARQAARARAPRGGPRRRPPSSPTATSRSPRSPSSSPAATRASTRCPRRASTGSSAARATTRPARRSTRWRSSSASAIPAGRSSTGSRAGPNDRAVEFTIARIKDGSADFSFSGIKTAVLLHVRREGIPPVADPARRAARTCATSWPRSSARSSTALVRGPRARPPATHRPRSLILTGGVAANRLLRARGASGPRGSWACPSSSRRSPSPPTTPR